MYSKNLKAYLSKFEGKYIISNSAEVYEVNEIGARIFDLCNGKNKLEDIVSILSKKYKINKELIFEDVKAYILILLEKKFIFEE